MGKQHLKVTTVPTTTLEMKLAQEVISLRHYITSSSLGLGQNRMVYPNKSMNKLRKFVEGHHNLCMNRCLQKEETIHRSFYLVMREYQKEFLRNFKFFNPFLEI